MSLKHAMARGGVRQLMEQRIRDVRRGETNDSWNVEEDAWSE